MTRPAKKKIHKKLLNCLFVLYIIFLLKVVLFKGPLSMITETFRNWQLPSFDQAFNIIPLFTIGGYLRAIASGGMNTSIIIDNLVGNILLFVPWGFLLPLIFKKSKSLRQVLLAGMIFVLCIEAMQFVTRLGSFDIDDLILNLVGVLIGYGIFRAALAIQRSCCSKRPSFKRAKS
ncbi:MAG: VanZ family protein [Bacillota bacterium]|jgi:glycopeptide antibiotics resistance protein